LWIRNLLSIAPLTYQDRVCREKHLRGNTLAKDNYQCKQVPKVRHAYLPTMTEVPKQERIELSQGQALCLTNKSKGKTKLITHRQLLRVVTASTSLL